MQQHIIFLFIYTFLIKIMPFLKIATKYLKPFISYTKTFWKPAVSGR